MTRAYTCPPEAIRLRVQPCTQAPYTAQLTRDLPPAPAVCTRPRSHAVPAPAPIPLVLTDTSPPAPDGTPGPTTEITVTGFPPALANGRYTLSLAQAGRCCYSLSLTLQCAPVSTAPTHHPTDDTPPPVCCPPDTTPAPAPAPAEARV